MGTVNVMTYY